ncbi:MAG: gliding motility-associated C-terminal domain-containing protein [Pricia sp.]
MFVALVFFGVHFSFGQLSDLHYLPPLKQGVNNEAVERQAVYLSTPETTAFTVRAFRGTSTVPLATFTISNTAPAIYSLPNGDNNITMVTNNGTGVVLTNGGLRFESDNNELFYINYRSSSPSQASSLTSKGRQALGRNFRWGGVPNRGTEPSLSTSLGIMASEDNTSVTVSGYDLNCVFRLQNNRAGITSNTINITLNRGESFVLEAIKEETTANIDGWLGASIVSDKDIAISNGGLNYSVFPGSSSRDSGIDQPVPENRIGKEYVFIRGNGTDDTEFPVIIATQNNTDIFVNNSPTPIANINAGDYFGIPGSNYSSGSPGANMLVITSKDAYAYQNLAGSNATNTLGLNFVAPLNCLLPDNLDNISNVTDAAGTVMAGGITIIASTTTPDSNITVTDGTGSVTLPASNAVSGSTLWKTYYLPNLTGNVSVQSSGPIAVGFFGTNGDRGIAGYFSGFDTVPDVDLQITGAGCIPGNDVEVVDPNFDAYQWYDNNGDPIPGAITSSYTPTLAGDYFVRVTKGGCTYDSQPLSAYYCNPDIKLTKTADVSQALEGDTVNFTVTVESLGVNPVTNLAITDLADGFSIVSASPSVGSWAYPVWNIGTLNAGELETIDIVATITELTNNSASAILTNTVTNSQDQTDTDISLDEPSVDIDVDNDWDLDGIVDNDDLDDDNDGIPDTDEGDLDSDGDGLNNRVDLDSDNDGIYDVVEAGHFQASSNGMVSGAVGANGLPDAVETFPDSGTINYVIAESADDSDALENYIDLDSDGDGIPDNVEAQTSLGYVPPNADDPATYSANRGMNSAYLGGLTPVNTDTADLPDYLDTNSDNEGAPDGAEAGLSPANSDIDNDGLDDATDADTTGYNDPAGTVDNPLTGSLILPDEDTDARLGGDVDFRDTVDNRLDSDNDGTYDGGDLDDDNDGIPDEIENATCYGGGASGLLFTEDFGAGDRTTTPYTNYAYEPDDWMNDGASINDGEYAILNDIQNSASWAAGLWVDQPDHTGNPNGRMALFNSTNSPAEEFYNRDNITVVPNVFLEFSFWVKNIDLSTSDNGRTLPNITVYVRDNAGAVTLETFSTGNVAKDEQWHKYNFTFDPGSNTEISFVMVNNASGGLGNDLVLDDFTIAILCDVDGDGVTNSLDLDSDNDGILDIVESGVLDQGATDADSNGKIDGVEGDFGNNGLFNAVESDDTLSATLTYTVAESSDDSDTIANFLDLDSDGDGIPDNTEAQLTLGYIPQNNDNAAFYEANEGVNSAYLGGLTPVNTDLADSPDYLDTDSDNEGGNDTDEAGLILTGNDSDNDGIDDVTDISTDYSIPGGIIDSPVSGGIRLPDVDNDVTTGGDVDFRDDTEDRPDTDSDGIIDAVDLDDDNDGIPDEMECSLSALRTGPVASSDITFDITGTGGAEAGILNSISITGVGNLLDNFVKPTGYTSSFASNDPNDIHEQYHAMRLSDITSPSWNTDIRLAFQSQDLNHYQATDNTIVATDTWTLTYDPVQVTTEGFLVLMERDGNNPYAINAYDAGGNLINASRYIVATTAYVDTPVNASNGQNIKLAIIPMTDFAPIGTLIGAIEFFAHNATGNGPDGKAFITTDGDICNDSDGDGIINSIDLDSDNDGIFDVVESGVLNEAGANDDDNDGRLDGSPADFGNNGLLNAIENDDSLAATTAYTLLDSDSDSERDAYELDSDNDGCFDVTEAGYTDGENDGILGDSPVSIDANGLVTSATDGYTEPLDADANGTFDYREVGITPTIDTQPINATVCSGVPISFTVGATNAGNYQWQLFDGTTWSDLADVGIYSGTATNTLQLATTTVAENGNRYRVVVSNLGYACDIPISDEVELIVEQTPDIIIGDAQETEGGIIRFPVTLSSIGCLSEDITMTFSFTNGTADTSDYTDSNVQLTITAGSLRGEVTVQTTDDDIDENDETFSISIASIDSGTVGDFSDTAIGTILDDDITELDSDDDGILDSFEDLNTDGDNDPATNPTNTDGDLYPDYLDIDSDNDGIPDNVEAQTTEGYIPPSLQDVNNNGLDDAYETGANLGIIPVNTDGEDFPDYLDADSDNDNVPDSIEGHDRNHEGIADVSFVGSDKDDDGLDDGYEGSTQIDTDVNDEIDDPANDLPNTDGDALLDYRDADDDNDEIATREEDGNADRNYANDDVDGDGTPDYLEANPPEVEVFNIVTPNDDGVHDYLMISGLEIRPNNSIQILNRWGMLVYESESYDSSGNHFNGTSQARATMGKDEKLPVGTYFYIFNYEDIDGSFKTLSGYLYLN